MEKKENNRPLVALVALAAAALVAAVFTFTNVTYWVINATKPPIAVGPGDDTTGSGRDYIVVDHYYDPTTGRNITRISIIGVAGYPTEFPSIMKLCNRHSSRTIEASLRWVGPVTTTGHEAYIKAFYVTGPGGQKVGFEGSTTYNTAGPFTINPGACIDIGAYVSIDANIPDNLADGRTVLGQYQVDIVYNIP